MLNAATFNPQSPTQCKMIIAYLGRNVKDYRKNFLRYLEKLILLCPVCSSNTVFHDCYDRHIHIDEKIDWISIQRLKCLGCGKTHAVLPDFIRPYKHYSACDAEIVLRDHEEGIPVEQIETAASISTVIRWIKEFNHNGQQMVGALRSLLFRYTGRFVNELKLVYRKTFGIMEQLLQVLPQIESSNLTIGETNIWLSNHMLGFFV